MALHCQYRASWVIQIELGMAGNTKMQPAIILGCSLVFKRVVPSYGNIAGKAMINQGHSGVHPTPLVEPPAYGMSHGRAHALG